MKKRFLVGSIITSMVAPAMIVACNGAQQTTTDAKKGLTKKQTSQLPQTIYDLKKQVPNYYKNLNNNAQGQDLFNSLNTIQKIYRTKIGSYKDLWTVYKSAYKDDFDEKDGTVYDIYSEKVGKAETFNFTLGEDQDKGGRKKVGQKYNREHLIPQSIFGKRSRYIRNDAHFVFPVDAVTNSYRSNYIHDNVNDVKRTGLSLGGNDWKIGKSITNGERAFEPDSNFKGDIARAYFYFMLTWHNYPHLKRAKGLDKYSPFKPQAFPYFDNRFLKRYMTWAKNDPVSKFEITKNNAIAKFHGGLRNPFIDMPQLINLIWQ